jgi:peptide/nickel transport system substrate-binding protein
VKQWQRRYRPSFIAGAATLASVPMIGVLFLSGVSPAAAAGRHHSAPSSAVVSLAEGAQGTPNFIMPFVTGANNAEANLNLQYQMWPTLYTISTPKSVNAINNTLSLAEAPIYSNGDTEVKVTLKPWKWSDGQPLTARDLTFFMNILKAEKTSWSSWAPGNMPTNVVSWTAQGTRTVIFKLTKAYNPTWFTDTELAHIVLMPQHAWDKETATGAVGTYDTTTAGAKAVYTFLKKQGEDTATYNSNPLWQVVDGAFKLKQYTSNSFVVLVPNAAYSGPDKPRIAKFEEIPYTSSTAEFNALLSGNVSLGYVPLNDLSEIARVKSIGYHTVRSALEAANMLSLNYHSPVVGPFVKQLYIREALNDVMDQPAQIKAILHGNGGYADYGPIPPEPPNPFMAPIQKKSPFNIAAAKKLLTSHGWKIPASGAATCVKPGTGPKDCGAGIAKGRKLTFDLVYVNGSGYLTATMANYKSDASQAGIVINLSQETFNSIVGLICGTATCDSPGWQIANWGAGFAENYNSPYPDGAPIFENHVGLDYPVTAKFNALIAATKTATGSKTAKAMKTYDTWVVQHQLEVWQIETYTVNAVSNKINDVWYSPITGNVYPQEFVVK